MKHLLIILGGELVLTDPLESWLKEQSFDEIIAGDAGLEYALKLGLHPDIALGDFDSVSRSVLEEYVAEKGQTAVFPVRKDDTDSEIAVRMALEKTEKGDRITVLGGLGGRLDHTLGNLFLLVRIRQAGVRALMTDGRTEVSVLLGGDEQKLEYRPFQKYVSLIPISERAEGIELKGFSYEGRELTLHREKTQGISNEVLPGGGRISLKEGIVLLIRTSDREKEPGVNKN